jgi:hypothetical protein
MVKYHWTPALDDRLRELRAANLPVAEVVVGIGFPYFAVYERSVALGIPFRRNFDWTPEKDQQLIDMVKAGGCTARQMAEVLGSNERQVWKRCKRLQLRVKRTYPAHPLVAVKHWRDTWTQERDAVLADRMARGVPPSAIASELGFHPHAGPIRKRCRKLCIPLFRPRVEWTAERDRILTETLAAGGTLADVAQLVGYSVWSVATRRAELGVPFAHESPGDSGVGPRYGLPASLPAGQVLVLLSLTGGPRTVRALASEIAQGEQSVRRRLRALQRGGFVCQLPVGRQRVYILTGHTIDLLTKEPADVEYTEPVGGSDLGGDEPDAAAGQPDPDRRAA